MNELLNQSAVKAATLGRTSKKELFELFKIAGKQSGVLTVDQMSVFYNFFIPKPPPIFTTDFEWCWSAVADPKKDKRPALHYVFVEQNIMVASNGINLHACPAYLADGFYNVVGARVDLDDLKFFEWRHMFVTTDTEYEWQRAGAIVEFYEKDGINIGMYPLPCGGYVNKSIWDLAIQSHDVVRYQLFSRGENHGVALDLPPRKAALMLLSNSYE